MMHCHEIQEENKMKQSGKMKVMAALLAGIMLLGSGFSMKEASAMEQNHG